jgi:hypothetical protein
MSERKIRRCQQIGQRVTAYDNGDREMFVLRGEYIEHAPNWVAVRCDGVTQVFDRMSLLRETLTDMQWRDGVRPTF